MILPASCTCHTPSQVPVRLSAVSPSASSTRTVCRAEDPSFVDAARPTHAKQLYRHFIRQVENMGIATQTGRFGAMMTVTIVNDGPVTIVIDSRDR